MSNDGGSRALSAAVRVALGALFVSGCGGTVTREPGREGEGASQDVTLGTGAPSSTGVVASPSAAPSPSTLDGCKAKLHAAFGDDAGADFWDPPRPLSKDPALVACCDAIAASNEPNQTEKFRNTGCCKVDVESNGRHCTPWGPPVPPAFVRRQVSLAEVA